MNAERRVKEGMLKKRKRERLGVLEGATRYDQARKKKVSLAVGGEQETHLERAPCSTTEIGERGGEKPSLITKEG